MRFIERNDSHPAFSRPVPVAQAALADSACLSRHAAGLHLRIHCIFYMVCFVLGSSFGVSSVSAQHPLPIAEVRAAMKTIQGRYLADLLLESPDFGHATQLAISLQGDGSWADIDYENLSSTGYDNARHLRYLRVLSLAYRTAEPNNPQRALYKAAALEALNYWLKHDYIAKNWWHNDIGNPAMLVDIVLLLDKDLSPVQRGNALRMASRADLNSRGARPGGDLVQLAQIMAKWAVLTQDHRAMTKAASTISSEVHLSVERGMQYDHSFHHRKDRVIQTTGYGKGFTQSVAIFAAHAANTVFELHKNKLEMLIDNELDGTRWILAFGKRPSPASMNRDLSRPVGMNEWSDDTPRLLMAATNYRKAELQNLMEVRRGNAKPAWSGNRYYWRSAYMAQQRPGYHAAVRMFSSRNANSEGPINAEGLKNHHLADGSCFITRTGEEYPGIAPVMDWQKIPGTTVVQKNMIPRPGKIARMGLTSFQGGVTDGTYGAAALDFISPIDPLVVKKAWFFFDQQIVALGSDIQKASPFITSQNADTRDYEDLSKDDEQDSNDKSESEVAHVVTTMNQTRLNGDVIVHHDDKTILLPPGRRALENVQWVHHDQTGYVFYEPQTAHVRNSIATGNWRQINNQPWATSDTVKEDLFALWVDHGLTPAKASYAYAIYPNTPLANMQALADKPSVTILANDSTRQAVMLDKPSILQAVFYEPGQLTFDLKLSANAAATVSNRQTSQNVVVRALSPCMLMIRQDGDDLIVTAADPTQTLRSLTFEFIAHTPPNVPAGAQADGVAKPKAIRQSRQVIFHLPISPMAGQSVSQRFKWPNYGL